MAPVKTCRWGAAYPVWPLEVVRPAARPSVPHWSAPTWKGATPRPEGLVRARGRARFHTPGLRPLGVAPFQISLQEGCSASMQAPRIIGSVRLPGCEARQLGTQRNRSSAAHARTSPSACTLPRPCSEPQALEPPRRPLGDDPFPRRPRGAARTKNSNANVSTLVRSAARIPSRPWKKWSASAPIVRTAGGE